MSYLVDKKIKRKKFFRVLFRSVIFFALFYFRADIMDGASSVGIFIFRPVLVAGNYTGDKFSNLKSYFLFKNSLYLENENLKMKLIEEEAKMANYNSILDENIFLKEILGRKNTKTSVIVPAILAKPNKSFYDTLVIDIGLKQGVKVGDSVFALGNIPIGRIAEVHAYSSKVILFSNSGEKTQVVINKNIFMEVVGRGGGNFEMAIPKDFNLSKGSEVVLPGIMPHVLAVVETVLSDPRDSFQKALLVSPANIQELKFVEAEIEPKALSEPLVAFVAYCLNPNHFHFVLKQLVDGGIAKFMQKLQGGYTYYFNVKNFRSGSLFQGTFKSHLMNDENYFNKTLGYVNKNYAIHTIPKNKQHLVFASDIEYENNNFNFISKIEGNRILEIFNGNKDFKKHCDEIVEIIRQERGKTSLLEEDNLPDRV